MYEWNYFYPFTSSVMNELTHSWRRQNEVIHLLRYRDEGNVYTNQTKNISG